VSTSCVLKNGSVHQIISMCNRWLVAIDIHRWVVSIKSLSTVFELITPVKSGFQKHRSTTDQLVCLETSVREAFIHERRAVAIFFDLEKAYDTTRKYGIMKDLSDAGLCGRLPMFISNFLKERQFQVRLGSNLSSLFDQEMGVPQGSILCVTLFAIKINSVVKACIAVCKLHDSADTNGFRFSASKTVCIHFCHVQKNSPRSSALPKWYAYSSRWENEIPRSDPWSFHLYFIFTTCISRKNVWRL